jgi:hypothetical protein
MLRLPEGQCLRLSSSGRARLAYRAAVLGWLAANLFFDSVQCCDAQHRLGGRGRSVSQVNVVELTPGSLAVLVLPLPGASTGTGVSSACILDPASTCLVI